jgi:hypothetical protein
MAERTIRNLFGLRCLLSMCPGTIDCDKHSVYWQCVLCGWKDRAPAIGDHWVPIPPAHRPDAEKTEASQ